MFEGLIASILNRYLSGYIDELNYKNLQIGLISGTVELYNLGLKPNALFQFNVPIKVKGGSVGKLRVAVPWRNIYNQPVIIDVEDVLVLVAPMDIEQIHDPAKIQEVIDATKRKRVKDLDKVIVISNEERSQGFVESLMDTVINNIQVRVKNVHVRYEDCTSIPNTSVALGILFKEFVTETTDEKGVCIKFDSKAKFVYKKARLNGLNVYFNSFCKSSEPQLLIEQQHAADELLNTLRQSITTLEISNVGFDCLLEDTLSLEASVLLNRLHDKESLHKPHVQLNSELKTVHLNLRQHQFLSSKRLSDYYLTVERNKKYVIYRPSDTVSANKKAWWIYPFTCVVEERIRSYSWERIKAYRKDYHRYKNIYREFLASKAKVLPKEADALELKLNIPTIMIARQHAKIELQRITGESVESGAVYELTKEEKEKIYEMIGFEDSTSKGVADMRPSYRVEFQMNLLLEKVQASLCLERKNVLNVVVTDIQAFFEIQLLAEMFKLEMKTRTFNVEGCRKDGTFKNLISSFQSAQSSADDQGFFHFVFDKNPKDVETSYKIAVTLLPIIVIYEYDVLMELLNFFRKTGLNELREAAQQNLAHLTTYSTAGLIYAIENHKRFHVSALVYSPIIIIPEFGRSGGTSLTFYLGTCELTSDLSRVTSFQQGNLSEISKLMYDKFKFKVDKVQILFGSANINWYEYLTKGEDIDSFSVQHILEPLSVESELLLSIRPKYKKLPQLVVLSTVDNVCVTVSNELLLKLGKFFSNLPIPFSRLGSADTNQSTNVQFTEDVFYDPSYNDLLSLNEDKKDTKSSLSLVDELDQSNTESSSTLLDVWSESFDYKYGPFRKLSANYSKLVFQFTLICVRFNVDEEDGKGDYHQYLTFALRSIKFDAAMTSYGFAAQMCLGEMSLIDNLNAYDNKPIDIFKSSATENLITLRFRKVESSCPSFATVYDSLPQLLQFQFSSLAFVCHQTALIYFAKFCLQFFLRLRSTGLVPKQRSDKNGDSVSIQKSDKGDDKKSQFGIPFGLLSGTKKTEISMIRIEGVLDEFKLKISTASADLANISVKGLVLHNLDVMQNESIAGSVSLKDFAVHCNSDDFYPDIVNLLDDNVFSANFSLQKNIVSIKLGVGRLRIVFIYRLFHEMIMFVDDFLSIDPTMKTAVYNQAKETVIKQLDDAKSELISSSGEGLKFDIKVNVSAPFLLVPRSNLSRDCFLVQMGDLLVTSDEHEIKFNEGVAVYNRLSLFLTSVQASRVRFMSTNELELCDNVIFPIEFTVFVSLLIQSRSFPPTTHYPRIRVESKFKLVKAQVSLQSAQLLFATIDDNILNVGPRTSSSSATPLTAPSPEVSARPKPKPETTDDESSDKKIQPGTAPTEITKDMEVSLVLEGVDVTIIELELSNITPSDPLIKPVSNIQISTSGVLYEDFSDKSVSVKFYLGPLSVDDVRVDSSLAVRRMFEPLTVELVNIEEPQHLIEGSATLSNDGDLFIYFKLDRMKVNLCLPFFLYLYRFAMNSVFYNDCGTLFDNAVESGKSFHFTGTQNASKFIKPVTSDAVKIVDQPVKSSKLKSITVKGDLALPDVALFAQPDRSDSKILLLRSKCSLSYTQDVTSRKSLLSFNVDDLSLVMSSESSASVPVVKPCTASLVMKQENVDNHDLIVTMKFSPMVINLTSSIYGVIIGVVTSLNEPGLLKKERRTLSFSEDKLDDFSFSLINLTQSKYKRKESAEMQSSRQGSFSNIVDIVKDINELATAETETSRLLPIERIDVYAESIFLVYSEEKADELVPLMIALLKLHGIAFDWNSVLTVRIKLEIECSYYNEYLNLWEPFIDPIMVKENLYRSYVIVIWYTTGEALQLNEKFENVEEKMLSFIEPYANSTSPREGVPSRYFTTHRKNINEASNLPTATYLHFSSEDCLNFNLTPDAVKLLWQLFQVVTASAYDPTIYEKEQKPFLEIWNKTGMKTEMLFSSKICVNPDAVHDCSIGQIPLAKETPKKISEISHRASLFAPVFSLKIESTASKTIDYTEELESLNRYLFHICLDNMTPLTNLSYKRSGTVLKTVKAHDLPNEYAVLIRISRVHSFETIVVSSTMQLTNNTQLTINLYCRQASNFPKVFSWSYPQSEFQSLFFLTSVTPGSTYDIPLLVVYHCFLFVAPDDPRYEPVILWTPFISEGNTESDEHINIEKSEIKWSKVKNKAKQQRGNASFIDCPFLPDLKNPSANFRFHTEYVSYSSMHFSPTPLPPKEIVISASMSIVNLLPIEIKLNDMIVSPGQSLNIHSTCAISNIKAEISYDDKMFSSFISVNDITQGSIFYPLKFTAIKDNKSDESSHLYLDACNRDPTLKHNSPTLIIFVRYWLVNQTGLNLEIKSTRSKTYVVLPANTKLRFFGSYKDFSKEIVRMRVTNGSWSSDFSIDVVGATESVTCPYFSTPYQISYTVSLGSSPLTKIVYFMPIYMLINDCKLILDVQEDENNKFHVINPGDSIPYWPAVNRDGNLTIKLRKHGTNELRSFSVTDGTSVALLLDDTAITIMIDPGKSTTIIFKNFKLGDAPVRLKNVCSNFSLKFRQALQPSALVLDSFQSIFYLWPSPSSPPVLYWSISSSKFEVDTAATETENIAIFDKDCNGSFSVGNSLGGPQKIYWISMLENSQRVLLFTDDAEVFASFLEPELCTFELCVSFSAILFSLINKNTEFGLMCCKTTAPQWFLKTTAHQRDITKVISSKANEWLEMQYHSNNSVVRMGEYDIDFSSMRMKSPYDGKLIRKVHSAVKFFYRQSELSMAIKLVIWNMKVDNQLPKPYFTFVFYPLFKRARKDEPFIEASVVTLLKDNLRIVRSLHLTTQEFSLSVDKGFLCTALAWLMEWWSTFEDKKENRKSLPLDVSTEHHHNPIFVQSNPYFASLIESDMTSCDKGMLKNLMDKAKATATKVILESVYIDEIVLHLSFSFDSSSASPEEDEQLIAMFIGQLRNLIDLSIGKTITEFSGVEFKFKPFQIEGKIYNVNSIIGILQNFYMHEAIKQAFVLVFGLNVFGNPYGLLKGFNEIVESSLYDPFLDSIQNPRQINVAIVRSLKEAVEGVFRSVNGMANSAALISNSAGRFLASITLDKKYEDIWAYQIRQNRSSSMPKSIAASGRVFASGFIYGISDFVLEPFNGAKKSGLKGFGKGLYKGTVGLLVKPIASTFGSGTIIFDALKRVASSAKPIKYERLPRLINPDLGLQPYSAYRSKGATILLQLQSENHVAKNEDYWTHLYFNYNQCILVTNKAIYILKKRKWVVIRRWKLKSSPIDITSLQKVIDDGHKIIFEKKPERLLSAGAGEIMQIDNPADRKWLCMKINTLIKLEEEKQEFLPEIFSHF